MLRLALALGLGLAAAAPAAAHTQSYGYLTATLADGRVDGRLELAVRDLDALAGLDGDGDGSVTWGEVRARETELRSTILGMVAIGDEASPCALDPAPLAVDTHAGETYLVAGFSGACAPAGPIAIGYDALFDLDATHRGIVTVTADGETRTAVMTPDARSLALEAGGAWSTALTFVASGIHHIWIGYDHILFLVTLMLGAVVVRRDGRWQPVDGTGRALLEVARIVTAFTAAHSVTLALAALDVVRLPVPLIEAAIAATISLAALNTIWPLVTGRLWMLAFGFGLIHGFGFANVLAEVALPAGDLVTALLSFNVGVEIGQLAIVAVVLPVLVVAARTTLYPKVALPALSLVIAGIGFCWLVGRTLGVEILPIG